MKGSAFQGSNSVPRGALGLLLATLAVLLALGFWGRQAHADSDPFPRTCRTRRSFAVMQSPATPLAGQPVRLVVVAEREASGGRLRVWGPGGEQPATLMQRGGPPFWWLATIERPRVGRHRYVLVEPGGRVLACGRFRVLRRKPTSPPSTQPVDYWPNARHWNRVEENLYSAWIEKLFDAPPDQRPSWTPLHVVFHDPARNLLYNHLGFNEDGPEVSDAIVVQPDCADLPHFLRAYFAWKRRLPFGYRHCSRGSSTKPPRCGELKTNVGQLVPVAGDRRLQTPAQLFSHFLRKKVSNVHSASGRTAANDDATDLYPVALSRRSLRPGTVYIDPYGHLLVVSRWIAQAEGTSGLLFAADAHPDLSVGRKRFWRGAFMFLDDYRGGAGGFKAFRPIVERDGQLVALTNEEIRKESGYRNYATSQYDLGLDGFYLKMDEVINPRALGPLQAYRERLKALHELIGERVDSVQAGEDHMKKSAYRTIEMPSGPRIFETRGPWEDFSTPARDMRLLIAIEDVLRYPDLVIKMPKRFALAAGENPSQARQKMLQLAQTFMDKHGIHYIASDGSKRRLSIKQIVERRKELEMAYNPNDCVELRWGASGDELRTCKRNAPADQRQRMLQYRAWFASRTRPPIR